MDIRTVAFSGRSAAFDVYTTPLGRGHPKHLALTIISRWNWFRMPGSRTASCE